MSENQQRAYRFFINKGLTPIQSAALVGNFVHESGSVDLNTRAINRNDAGPGQHSIGIAQWNRGRLAGLEKFAKNNRGTDIYDLQTQLEYVWYELNHSHKPVLDRLKKTTNIVDATHIVNRHYEVSQDSMGGTADNLARARQNRLGHASKLLQSQGYDHTITPSQYSNNNTMFIEGITPERYMQQQQRSSIDDNDMLDFWTLLSMQPEFSGEEDDDTDDYYNDLLLANLIKDDTATFNNTTEELDDSEDDEDTLSAYYSLQDQNDYNEMMMALILSAQYPNIERHPSTKD